MSEADLLSQLDPAVLRGIAAAIIERAEDGHLRDAVEAGGWLLHLADLSVAAQQRG